MPNLMQIRPLGMGVLRQIGENNITEIFLIYTFFSETDLRVTPPLMYFHAQWLK